MRTGLFIFLILLAGLASDPDSRAHAAQGDMVFQRQAEVEGSEAFPPSIFPHWVHRIRYRCYVCHEALFVMQQGENPVNMEKIKKGQYCGACHNGRVAFSVEFKNCGRCHRAPAD